MQNKHTVKTMLTSIRNSSWGEAAWIFLLSRFAIIVLTLIAVIHVPMSYASAPRGCVFTCTLSWWFHWDVVVYAQIARNGYSALQYTVFFPLWPFLLHWAGMALGYYVAGLVLANLCFYIVLVLLYKLVAQDFDPSVAKKTLFYVAFAPYAIFFFVGYTEALFLLLCLAVFLCLQRGRWWLAGLCGFLAALTRSQGVLLVVPFGMVLIQRLWLCRKGQIGSTLRQKIQASIPLLLIPLGVVVYMLYLGHTTGHPLAFSTEEARSWNRHLTFPLLTLFRTARTFFQVQPTELHLFNALDLFFTLFPIIVLALSWKRIPLHYTLFALALIVFDLSYPQGVVEPLLAAPRYMLIIFPVYVVLALWGKKYPRFEQLLQVGFLPLFALNVVFFVSHYWVS